MRRIALAILMIIFSTACWADEKDDQRNVYDVFREPPSLPEQQLTARIKRHMANLLYPVDMSSYLPRMLHAVYAGAPRDVALHYKTTNQLTNWY